MGKCLIKKKIFNYLLYSLTDFSNSSEAGSSVENWAYNWLCNMFNNIHDEILNNVLCACKLALKRDIKILTFCLPHVVCKYFY